MKKTKIVATIGPASESKEVLRKLFSNGVNVCRLNFSHGSHEEHQKRIDTIKEVRTEMDLPIAIMLDTKGPEIRLGDFKEGTIEINQDDIFTLTSRDILGDNTIVSVTYKGLPNDVEVGGRILIDDGLVELQVLEIIDNTDIKCIAINSGTLKNHKGVNVPNVKINLPAVTEKDIEDIKFGIKNEIDFVAVSFVRTANDVNVIRRILEENAGQHIELISKIESQQGVDNIDEILQVSDGIMVARGDLGVEVQTEEIPLIQKMLIQKCNIAGKPVITATQMLDSMMRNPRPTRAEVTDVANAILDGSSAIMLSGETAAGKYPVEAVKMMHSIAITTEDSLDYGELLKARTAMTQLTITNAIGKATCTTAQDLDVAAIITATSSGHTSKAISKFRPKAPIIAVTTTESVRRKLALEWGVYPITAPVSTSTDEVLENSISAAIKNEYVSEGDLVVITAGIPVGLSGTTNMIKVHTIGKVLLIGQGIGNKVGTGRVCIGNSEEDLLANFEDGDIIVTNCTHKEMVTFMERASAIIAEEGGLTSHSAIVGLNLEKPTIVGAKDARSILKNGDIVTVDSSTGQVFNGQARVL
ncbi:pyruvate kinase [Tissierella sp. Yu-01]|uniref:pyruvate kinase n=1 Tax=Tissierella sp. Yu-01 TaxID=3035694 RepID=UPI00240E0F01|nr:pyruvate kinase [Tissierella sp. Yu-01]WFA09174.1 pyruvate kinase [Tissierella sp. Yu-01]